MKGESRLTPRAQRVLDLSLREALQLGHNYIGPEHILLGLIRDGENVAAQALGRMGVKAEDARRAIIALQIQPGAKPTGPEKLEARVESLERLVAHLYELPRGADEEQAMGNG